MNSNYKVGELVYDPNIYDGLNTFLFDLEFYKKWLPKDKNANNNVKNLYKQYFGELF